MNKSFPLFGLLFIALLFFISCEKADMNSENYSQPTALQSEKEVSVENGILHFRDYEAYSKIHKKILKMSDSDFENWEKSLGFKSLRTLIYEASTSFGDLKTERDLSAWKEKYNDILILKNEDVIPRISSYYFHSFINRKGEYFVGDEYNKVVETKLITITDGDKNKLSQAVSLNESSKKDGILITKLPTSQVSLLRSNDGCNPERNSGYDVLTANNRKIYIRLEVFLDPYGPVGSWYETVVYLNVYGKKKGTFGWHHYSTLLAYDDVSFSVMDQNGVNHIVDLPSEETDSPEQLLKFDQNYGSAGPITGSTLSPKFNWLKGRAISSGVGDNNWVTICCDLPFPYSCPSPLGADPF